MPNKPTQIILHHTAVSYKKNPDQYEATKKYHISKGWGDIGYHYEIAKNGKVYIGRQELQVGAHTKEDNVNYNSIGICIDGNFDVELPTIEQENALRELLLDIMKRRKIDAKNIFPHRHYAKSPITKKPYKSCFGNLLPDDWGRNLVTTPPVKNKVIYLRNGRYYRVDNGVETHLKSMEEVNSYIKKGYKNIGKV